MTNIYLNIWITEETMTKKKDVFNKSCKKLNTKKDKFWSSLIDYLLIIAKISGLPKTHKPRIPLRTIV